MRMFRTLFLAGALAVSGLAPAMIAQRAAAASAADITRDSQAALERLYEKSPAARAISHQAKAILIFPHIIKAGLVVGGSLGEGELREGGRVADFYRSVSGSWGLQAGAQSYGYVVFLMSRKAVDYLHQSQGWEIGVGPTVVVVDEGVARNLSSTTLKDDAYAFIFGQEGLMAGVSIEGSKISKIHPK
jgi:lipid-binding SYLF domain-containing protein